MMVDFQFVDIEHRSCNGRALSHNVTPKRAMDSARPHRWRIQQWNPIHSAYIASFAKVRIDSGLPSQIATGCASLCFAFESQIIQKTDLPKTSVPGSSRLLTGSSMSKAC